MTYGKLPPYPHIDHLRKEAKRRLALLQVRAAGTRLSEVQHALAREYGFSNWSLLKAAVAHARTPRKMPWRWLSPEEEDRHSAFFPGAAALPTGLVIIMAGLLIILAMLLGTRHALAAPSDTAFQAYVGNYRLDSRHLFVVTEKDGHLYAQLANQPQLEIFPQSGTTFAPKGIAAEIVFTLDGGTQAATVTIHQNGHDITMPRLTAAEAAAIAALPTGHPMPVPWPQKNLAPHILTPASTGFDAWPCYSPNGETILFSRSSNFGRNWHLFEIRPGSGNTVSFVDLPVGATRCNWSSQGMIAVTGVSKVSTETWIMKSDGSDAHAVTAPGLSQPEYPSWYPGDSAMAVVDNLTVKRFGLAGEPALALTDRTQVLAGMPSVSPDGHTVAFAGQKNAGQPYDQEENAIWLTDGHTAHPLEQSNMQGRAPVWSPDGTKIAFESDRGNAQGRYAIFLINRDGSGLTQLTDFAWNANHPVFSRDGRHIVFDYGAPLSGIAVIDLNP